MIARVRRYVFLVEGKRNLTQMWQLAELVGQAGQLIVAQIQELQPTNSFMFSILSLPTGRTGWSAYYCLDPETQSTGYSLSNFFLFFCMFPHSLSVSLSSYLAARLIHVGSSGILLEPRFSSNRIGNTSSKFWNL